MRKVFLVALFSLILVPGSMHVAWAGKHDNNGTESGGGGGNPDGHDNNGTQSGSGGGNPDNHDSEPCACILQTQPNG